MRRTTVFDVWKMELGGNLGFLRSSDADPKEPAYARALTGVIVASARMRWFPKKAVGSSNLLVDAERFLEGVRWARELRGNLREVVKETEKDMAKALGDFDSGLEDFDHEELSSIATELLYSRDDLWILSGWAISKTGKKSGIKVPAIYSSDKKLRELLPDVDVYLGKRRSFFGRLPSAGWVWKERKGCLSSISISRLLQGEHLGKVEKAHLDSCAICSNAVNAFRLPVKAFELLPEEGHPHKETLEKYKALRLPRPDRAVVEKHLATCRNCRSNMTEQEIPAQSLSGRVVIFLEKLFPGGFPRPILQFQDMSMAARDIHIPDKYLSPITSSWKLVRDESWVRISSRLIQDHIEISVIGKKGVPVRVLMKDKGGKTLHPDHRKTLERTVYSLRISDVFFPLNIQFSGKGYKTTIEFRDS